MSLGDGIFKQMWAKAGEPDLSISGVKLGPTMPPVTMSVRRSPTRRILHEQGCVHQGTCQEMERSEASPGSHTSPKNIGTFTDSSRLICELVLLHTGPGSIKAVESLVRI